MILRHTNRDDLADLRSPGELGERQRSINTLSDDEMEQPSSVVDVIYDANHFGNDVILTAIWALLDAVNGRLPRLF